LPIIEVKNLSKRFGDILAVDQVSFDLEEGEVFGFLGPNGAGKTTTINVLCTLLQPTSGEARVNGFDCVREAERVRASIGIVFQDPTLDNELTAYENLKFHCYLYGMDRATMQERIEDVLALVDLYERRHDLVKKFSGGMKRRLEIARGLLHYPKVLFLDEPTLGLDPQTRNLIWDFIHDLRRREGITMFMTTHYLEEAEACDRIAIIDLGRIIALGSPAELKRMVRGDVIHLRAPDAEGAKAEIEHLFSIPVKRDGDGLYLEVASGEEFIPGLASRLKAELLSISLRKPTLNDVFLHLTGRQIREEEVSSKEATRHWMRTHRVGKRYFRR